jgi:hypothetical protein
MRLLRPEAFDLDVTSPSSSLARVFAVRRRRIRSRHRDVNTMPPDPNRARSVGLWSAFICVLLAIAALMNGTPGSAMFLIGAVLLVLWSAWLGLGSR